MSAATPLAPCALRVALDLRHPLAYLALRPALDFARELAIEVDWLPFAGEALRAPSAPGPDDDRGLRHRRHRARMIAREIAVYAGAQGVVLREPYRSGPSDAAQLAWLWVRARAPGSLPTFLEELFRRYWALELDANDRSGAVELLRRLELHPAEFESWAADEGPREMQRVAGALREAGVQLSPTYLVGDEHFVGRQHLPMIRWILEGRTGPPPI
jgi:2-hydroxychromene-2-carboxylate isomerase